MKKHLHIAFVMLIPISVSMFLNHYANAQAPNWLWAVGAGGSNSDFGYSIAVDGSGNRYITGMFSSTTITFGSTTLTNASIATDFFVAKYDAAGNALWAKQAGGSQGENGRGVAVDGSGNCFVTGSFASPTISFDTITLTNGIPATPQVFIAKYDASGNILWVKSAGGFGQDVANSIAVDASGNSYITGVFASNAITFGSTTLNQTSGAGGATYDIFIVKYDASGNTLWAKKAGGTADDTGMSIAIDAGGNSYITGNFNSLSLDFGTTTLTGAGGDIYIVKYDTNGNLQWAANASFGGVNDVAVDPAGNSFVCGSFMSSITFGSTTLTSAGNTDMFVAKYNSSGNPVWATSVGGSSYEGASAVSTDGGGNFYLTGYFQSPSVTFGSNTLTLIGGSDLFVTKYSSAGNALWATSAGGSGNDQVNGLALDGSGSSHLIGTYYSPTIAFGSSTLTNGGGGNADVYLAELSGVTGLNEINGNENFISLSPNPSSANFTIAFSSTIKNGTVEIINEMGEKVLMENIMNESKKEIHLINNVAGIYFVKVFNGEKSCCRKIIIDHS